ncbi:acyl-CoA dehydrogenase family protein [Pseudorhodoferax soli]|uniref:Alkylation response protein AidB-like acyl-CoA dehydrogenase n=1 Tax=Pseudorhodoferax soli TaxID=545864 RepID=A0A368Y3S0_9BURK|nr:acyl-CoA dehydrogenase family protein [Pseudorhodoferax soli]RCW74006.1 alkylation response protein AidB-like acyl-CoA dehydrogenase [Pseudorhodoferax soli]
MDLNYSPEELAFRDEVRGWLDANLPADIRDKVTQYKGMSKDDIMRWHKILAAKGWAVPHWPVEWGGTGWDVTQRYLYEEQFGLAGAPALPPFGPSMCASVLLKFGTPQQKERFLPRIREGDDFWVQGYSEPGAGSDLAALKTRAVRDGDVYRVTGQKIWTTLGHFGDWIFCLVRTDPTAEKRQEGISFLLIDMQTPGITVRPLILMDGGHEVNEVFFDDVAVPVQNLVHEENRGWTVAKYLLGHERMGSGNVGGSRRELAALKALAQREQKGGKPLIDDPRFRDRLSRVEIELDALELTSMRFLDKMRRSGQPPGADVSMLKIRGTEVQQMITELMMQAAGPMAQPFKAVEGGAIDHFSSRLAPRYFNYRKASIYAGSNEIQRNIIAKMTLGL